MRWCCCKLVLSIRIEWRSLACTQLPKCFTVCIHPHVYASRGTCVCAATVLKASASCCNACINTLLGLSKLSVNWGGKSLCAALFSHVTLPFLQWKTRVQSLEINRPVIHSVHLCSSFSGPAAAPLHPSLSPNAFPKWICHSSLGLRIFFFSYGLPIRVPPPRLTPAPLLFCFSLLLLVPLILRPTRHSLSLSP